MAKRSRVARHPGRAHGGARRTRPAAPVREADQRAGTATRDPFEWLIAAFIVAAAVAAFAPALRGDFLHWDDDRNFLNNQSYRGLGWSHLRWMFTAAHMGHYIPVTWITLALDYLVWGMNPFGYHLTNVLLHAANALLVYAIARRLLALTSPRMASHPIPTGGHASWTSTGVGASPVDAGSPATRDRSLSLAAAGAALLFAIHPLRVESVAWITERRDVLSGFFYLAAVLAYLRAAASGHAVWRRCYAVSLVAFALALLSKSMAVSLPVVLLILDVYPLRRLRWPIGPAERRVLIEKVPFVGLSLVVSAVAVIALAGSGNMSDLARVGVADRVAISLYSLAFYLWKSLVPLGLSPLYELPAGIDFRAWPFAVSAGVVLSITGLAVLARRRWPAVAAAWAAYVAVLLPVLGIVHNGHQIAADRYTYLATIPWAIVIAGALRAVWRRAGGGEAAASAPRGVGRTAVLAASMLGIGILFALTWTQSRHWRTTEALWRHALAVTPSALAHMNVGIMLDKRGQLAEAMALHERALALRPDIAIVHVNAALTLSHQQRLPEAIRHLERALALKPGDVPTHTSLAAILLQQGRWTEAAEQARRALARDPAYPEAHNNLAAALGRQGDVDGAIRHYELALAERPSHDPGNFMVAVAQHNLGNALLRRGRVGEAVVRLRQAVATQPTSAEMRNSLAVALARDGRFTEAATQLEDAIRLDPSHAQARENLRQVQARLGAASGPADASPTGSGAGASRP
jgi:tetratricopeptide (TPR) repeat protein